MFSMRKRLSTRYDTIGPGPAHHPGKMTRDGPPRNPMYSLGRQVKQLSKFRPFTHVPFSNLIILYHLA